MRVLTLVALLALLVPYSANLVLAQDQPIKIQQPIEQPKKKKRDKSDPKLTLVVRVSDAKLTSENIAGAWFYTLTGTVTNNTQGMVQNVIVNYEVVAPDTGKLLAAGSTRVNPELLQNGGQGRFMVAPNAGGNVRVTLVEWSNPDRSYGSFAQLQTFAGN